jgi:hypothetical protein
VTVTTTGATTLGTYPVRAQVADSCGAVETRGFNVVVGAPVVVLAIASTQVAGGNGLLEPSECNSYNVSSAQRRQLDGHRCECRALHQRPGVSVARRRARIPTSRRANRAPTSPRSRSAATGGLDLFSSVNLTLTVSYAGGGSPFAGPIAQVVGQPLGTNYVFTASAGATLPNDGVLVTGSNANDEPIGGKGKSNEPVVT